MQSCAVCREQAQDEAEKCPHCGTWIVHSENYELSFEYANYKNIRIIKGISVFFTVLWALGAVILLIVLAAPK